MPAATEVRFGWIPDVPDQRDHLYAAPAAPVAGLPPSVDLRSACPPVYDQGMLGSCTANAIAGAFEFDLKKQGLTDFIPSRLFIYYNERVVIGTVDEDSGAMIRDGMKSIDKQGVCREIPTWPYDITRFKRKPPKKCYTEARKNRAVLYQRVPRLAEQMKGCLASGYPFVFGFAVYNSLLTQAVQQSGDIPMPAPDEKGPNPDGSPAGHAMLVVGYDDATRRFFIRNSWGTGWGRGGYGTIPYDYLLNDNLSDDFWTLRAVTA